MLFINLIYFRTDKYKAKHNQRRIQNRTLLSLAFIGGSIGGLIAMYVFRHKTKQMAFVVGIPLMLVIQIVLTGIFIYL
ncbi:DUF1294 domain-containing protein [Fundicoccus sp. Sow4_H7]|uniref:DUF1294 domain-containing protein n=1 Tax=Fundicoccus sp. Sow4_H7 TaxID=3438784 RepID=UPI003F8EDCBA